MATESNLPKTFLGGKGGKGGVLAGGKRKPPRGSVSFIPSPGISDPQLAADEQSAAERVAQSSAFAGAAAHAEIKKGKQDKKRGAKESVFASALDALDALDEAAGEAGKSALAGIGGKALWEAAGVAAPYVESAVGKVAGAKLPGKPVFGPKDRPRTVASEFGAIGKGLGVGAIKGIGGAIEAVGDVTAPVPTGIRGQINPIEPKGSSIGIKTTPVSVQDVAGTTVGAIGKAVGAMPFLYGSAAPAEKDYYSISNAYKRSGEIAAKPNTAIDVSSENKALPPTIKEDVAPAAELTQSGQGSDAANAYLRQRGYNVEQATSVFDQNSIDYLQRLSDQNGWPKMDEAFKTLSPGEMLFQAYTKNEPVGLALRNAVVSLASGMAVPAAFVGIGKETYKGAKTGDWQGAKDLLVTALEPISGFNRVAERDGIDSAIRWAFVNYPVDSIFLAKGAWNAAGRGAGIAARLAGSEYARAYVPVTVPGSTLTRIENIPIEPPVPRVQGRVLPTRATMQALAKDAEERAAYEAEVAAATKEARVSPEGVPYRTVESPVSGPAQIGTTSPNLWRTFVTRSVKTRLASVSPPKQAVSVAEETVAYRTQKAIADASRWYRNRLEQKASERDIRLGLNIKQGIDIQIQEEFMRILGRRATNAEHQRAVFELTWPKELYGGKRLTPEDVVAYFDGRIKDLDAGQFPSLRGVERGQQRIRWDRARVEWQKIADTKLDPEVVSKLRKLGRGYGRKNAQYVADALGVTLDEAKRADYLRVLVIDPDFMVAATAKGTKRAEAAVQAGSDLNVLHDAIVKRSAELAARTTKKGFGKSGSARKRIGRFEVRRDELAAMLGRAEMLADQLGETALAAEYASIRELLTSSREVRAEALAQAERSVARVEAEGETALGRLRAKQAVAQAEAATTRGRPLAKAPSSRVIGLSEQAVVDARKKLAEVEGRTLRSEAAIAREQENVAKAEARLNQLRDARRAQDEVDAAAAAVEAENKAAKRAAKKQTLVLDAKTVDVTLDATEQVGTVVFKQQPSRLTKEALQIEIDRALNEELDAYIARLEASDKQAVLHLVQRPNFVYQEGRQFGGSRAISDTFLRPGRLLSSDGTLFAMGGEDTARMFWNLMEDTSEFVSSESMGERMNQLIAITSVPIKFTESQQEAANQVARELLSADSSLSPDDAIQLAAERVLMESEEFTPEIRYRYSVTEWKVVNAKSPRSRKPVERTNVPTETPEQDIATLLLREIDARSIDTNAPGEYYLMPRGVYNGIKKALEDESFSISVSKSGKPRKLVGGWDKMMRAWRTLTLNVLPKTVFNNFGGSVILAIQAGATPRDFYYAWRAMRPGADGRKLPLPPELQQRFFQQETSLVGTKTRWGSDSAPYLWAAAHMNNMRFWNGFSEDFARLAVWYSKAAPEAKQAAALAGGASAPIAAIARMRGLNDRAIDLLEAMARRDPEWRTKHEAYLQYSFDFLGDLHKGGPVWATVRLAIPFAQWYWHMLKLTFFTMPLKYPGRALMLQRLADIGDEYQRTHGVVIPWGASMIPLFQEVQLTPQGQQWVTSVVDSSPWYPQATALSMFTREGEIKPIGFTQQSVSPFTTNAALAALSVLTMIQGGAVQDVSEDEFLKAARDEFGVEITAKNWPAVRAYIANRLFMNVPLSPFIMSMQARPSTAFPGRPTEKIKDYPALQPDRVDVETLFRQIYDAFKSPEKATWDASAYAKFMGRLALKGFTGIQTRDLPGVGPIESARLQRLFEQLDLQFKKDFENRQKQEEGRIAAAMYDAQNGTNTFNSVP